MVGWRCNERLINDRIFMQLELANKSHLEYMIENRVNNEAVEKFWCIFSCYFAHFFYELA